MESCPQCHANLAAEPPPGRSTCPQCGAPLPAATAPRSGPPPLESYSAASAPGERTWLRIGFWLLLLAPPLAVSALVAKPGSAMDVLPLFLKGIIRQLIPVPAQIISVALAGAAGAAYCLARLHTRPARPVNTFGIVAAYTCAILLFDFCLTIMIAFVGCLLR